MVVGELMPKAVAVSRPFATARTLAPAARIYSTVFYPFIAFFGGAADRIVRAMGIEPTEELNQVRSRRELVEVLSSSGDEGTLGEKEVELLTRAFRFGEKVAADALTPRTDVVSIAADAVAGDLAALSVETGLSRFPVIAGDLDEVLGVVHVKATFDVAPEQRDTTPVADLMDPPLVVPESLPLDELLLRLRDEAIYLAVVGDEYGGTAGIITLEDLLEEIVGEIDDEHDRARHRLPLWKVGGDVMASGRLHLDELEDAVGVELPEGEYETLGGLVMEQLGRIPEVGDRFEVGGWRIEVEEMDHRRVAMVRMVPPPEPAESSEGDHAS
jgi:CBS domain containing-hemolysin-like protein